MTGCPVCRELLRRAHEEAAGPLSLRPVELARRAESRPWAALVALVSFPLAAGATWVVVGH